MRLLGRLNTDAVEVMSDVLAQVGYILLIVLSLREKKKGNNGDDDVEIEEGREWVQIDCLGLECV